MGGRRAVFLAALLGLSVTSCGHDTAADTMNGGTSASGGPGNVSSGVDREKPATEASEAEAAQVCTAFESAQSFAEEIEDECTAVAVRETKSEAECVERRDGCIKAETDERSAKDEDDGCHGEDVRRGLASCDDTVTIGDIESCLNEVFGQEAELTCADAASPPPEPACFAKLLADCPFLFDGPDDDQGEDRQDGERFDDDNSGERYGVDLSMCVEREGDMEVDCKAFCAPLGDAGCKYGPDADECMTVCALSKSECPGLLGELAACQTREQPKWFCDEDGDPDLDACEIELVCFGACLDQIIGD